MGVGKVGLHLHCLLQRRNCIVELPTIVVGGPEVVLRLSEVWLYGDRPSQDFDSLWKSPQFVVDGTKVIERFRVIRFQADRFLIGADCLLVVILCCRLIAALSDLRVSVTKIVV